MVRMRGTGEEDGERWGGMERRGENRGKEKKAAEKDRER